MNLLKMSFAISLIGIFLLLMISNTPAKKVEIEKINSEFLNKKIKVSGSIKTIKNYRNFQIIKIKDSNEEINLVQNKKINLTKNQIIQVIGKVDKYKDNFQIRTEKIILIKSLFLYI
ncbi:hypothetical protein GF386_03810 [Candidatus Pacearchaeota archaeon]|nr:hypothetical protein [Candidatus Pacearchaeota archaeon]MBD3283272.1 hypothetical protein [Candidatus Pacearchaeota archaeon]